MLSANAPGKLILSGEHSVVYGAPAIAVAVNHFITSTFIPTPDDHLTFSSSFGKVECYFDQIAQKAIMLDQRFERFLQGKISVNQILAEPSDLLFYTAYYAGVNRPGSIQLNSTIPVGAGMGSSAAVIAALLKLFSRTSMPRLSHLPFYQQVQHCERLQHGRGSAIDAAAVSFGGAVKVQDGAVESIALNLGKGWYRYHSGPPRCSTGETVAFVKKYFSVSEIWSEFSEVTLGFEQSMGQPSKLLQLMKANHRLLQKIGVVPETTAMVIEQIERFGGAAKVCGAGAHQGDAAGQVLVFLPDRNAVEVAQMLDIELSPIQQQPKGAYCA
jgi:mevalonate kinase